MTKKDLCRPVEVSFGYAHYLMNWCGEGRSTSTRWCPDDEIDDCGCYYELVKPEAMLLRCVLKLFLDEVNVERIDKNNIQYFLLFIYQASRDLGQQLFPTGPGLE